MPDKEELRLLRPNAKYKEAYLSGVRELEREGSLDVGSVEATEKDFNAFLQHLEREEKGNNLAEGRVPQTVFWLFIGETYLGRVSVRHKLTEKLENVGGHIGYIIVPSQRRKGYGTKMLQLVLPHAKELGLERVLVTCDETNIASRKIIESAGGVFEDAREQGEGKPKKLRFWINLK